MLDGRKVRIENALDRNGKVYEANQEFAHTLGYSLEEVHPLHVWDWDTQFTKEQLMRMSRSIDDTGEHLETRHRRKNGTSCDVEISTNWTHYRGQKLIFCVCRDISGRKLAEKEKNDLIIELNKALAEAKMLQGIIPFAVHVRRSEMVRASGTR